MLSTNIDWTTLTKIKQHNIGPRTQRRLTASRSSHVVNVSLSVVRADRRPLQPAGRRYTVNVPSSVLFASFLKQTSQKPVIAGRSTPHHHVQQLPFHLLGKSPISETGDCYIQLRPTLHQMPQSGRRHQHLEYQSLFKWPWAPFETERFEKRQEQAAGGSRSTLLHGGVNTYAGKQTPLFHTAIIRCWLHQSVWPDTVLLPSSRTVWRSVLQYEDRRA